MQRKNSDPGTPLHVIIMIRVRFGLVSLSLGHTLLVRHLCISKCPHLTHDWPEKVECM